MAIEPKSPRKRAVKKSKGKSKVEESTSEASSEVTVIDEAPTRATKAGAKKTAAIPVPIFQAAEVVAPPRARKSSAKKADAEKTSI